VRASSLQGSWTFGMRPIEGSPSGRLNAGEARQTTHAGERFSIEPLEQAGRQLWLSLIVLLNILQRARWWHSTLLFRGVVI
jgi:hypothetical protein